MATNQSLTLTQVSQSVENNTSKVRILWTTTQTGSSFNDYEKEGTYWISVNGGAEEKHTVYSSLPLQSTKTIVDTTIDVAHNPAGECTVKVRTRMDTSLAAGVIELEKTLVLTTIPRAATITAVGATTLGNACSVKWTPASASFRYKLKFAIGNWSYTTGAIHPNTTAAYTYSGYKIPLEAANQFKTKTGKMTVTLYTYSNTAATTQVGSADAEQFTVTVPENDDTRPKVSMTLAPVSTLSAPFDSLYIQGKSKVQATLGLETKFGADITESNISLDGITYVYPYESGQLTKDGSYSVKATVKDSRGHTGTVSETITVIPYSKPIVRAASGESNIVAARCDAGGNIKDSGTYLKIKAKIIYDKVVSGNVQTNFGKIQYRYRAEGGLWSDWYTILDSASTESTEVTTGALLGGALSVKTNYQVQVRAIDDIDESKPVTLSVPSDDVYMDRPAGGKGMGLGGYCSGPGNLDIYWKTKARGGISLYEAGEELNLGRILPLPRGEFSDGWNPNSITNGIHVIENSAYPLKDPMGNVLMENGLLIQMPATTDGYVLLQMAFPTDTHTPVYRLKWYTNWSDWTSFKI